MDSSRNGSRSNNSSRISTKNISADDVADDDDAKLIRQINLLISNRHGYGATAIASDINTDFILHFNRYDVLCDLP